MYSTEETATIAKHSGVSYSSAVYWRRKVEDPNFHSADWGGTGRKGYVADDRYDMKVIVCRYLVENSAPNLAELAEELGKNGFPYSRSSVSRLLQRWRWTFKIPTVFQRLKYTPTNMQYYNYFVQWLETADLARLKFVDEVPFDRRGKHAFRTGVI